MTQSELAWHATAAANIREARKKHGRLGTTKSRNGCLTCKRRRVKCDETLPECNRCRASGRQCSRYTESTSTSPCSKSASSVATIWSALSPSPSLQGHEKRQLDFFISRAGPRLAGAFDKDFWCDSVLQVAQGEPIILDCLLAISILYEHPQYLASFRTKCKPEWTQSAFQLVKRRKDSTPGDVAAPVDPNHGRALKLYNRAIRRFKQRMSNGSASPVLALVSCILFVCIETIRDHVFAAMSLYHRGIEMLNQLSASVTSSTELALVALVRRMFLRLGVLAATFGQPTGALLKLDNGPHTISGKFSTLAEARIELFAVLAECNSFTLASNEWRDALFRSREWRDDAFADGPGYPCPVKDSAEIAALFSDLRQRHTLHMQKLVRWREAFEPLLTFSDPADAGSLSYLLMLYYTWLIWIPTRLSHRKTAFDVHAPQFRQLIHHAEIFINHHANEKPVFTFDIGAIPSLYWTASECRVPSLRRRALALLKKGPKKESILGADSSAEIACRLIAIEERGLGLPHPAEFCGQTVQTSVDDSVLPAEESRVHQMEVVKNGRGFEVRVVMMLEADGWLHWKVEHVPI